MVLAGLSSALPWNWSSGHSSSTASSDKHRGRSGKKLVRTRADQLRANGDAEGSTKDGTDDEGYYPGIVNISGTYCFMDSTLQAMASLSYLQPHIDEIHAKAEELDVPTPVVDALRDILHTLNTPSHTPKAIRPVDIIQALAHHSKGKNNALFSSREHQDAQELFQLLSEAIKSEATAVHKEGLRDRGLGGFAPPRQNSSVASSSKDAENAISKGVFDGLTANRRSCVTCGYTEAVMHFAFDNWQLSVPRQAACRLEDCLSDYTRLEVLTDCICRKCSMVATHARLVEEAEKLTETTNADPDPSSSKKKRAREARKLVARVKAALDEGRIEEDLKGVKMEKVFSQASTKQAMIARPPPVLALHLNRSMHFGHYATKNTCRVVFPEILDLTPFTTSGKLSTQPASPISAPPPPLPLNRSTTPTPSTYATPRTLYRLSAVVVHYGQHSFGHYVCYRRKPRSPTLGAKRYAPPRLHCPLGCECPKCERYGPVREDDDTPSPGSRAGSGVGWLRISDDDVRECGIESVMQEGSGAFMLYYERVAQHQVYANGSYETRCSEETLKAPCATKPNGSVVSLSLSILEAAAKVEEEREREEREKERMSASVILSSSPPRTFGPRIVRNANPMNRRESKSPASSLSSTPESSILHSIASSSSSFAEGKSIHHHLANGVANGHAPHSDNSAQPSASSPLPTSPSTSAQTPSEPIPIPIPHSEQHTSVRSSSPSPPSQPTSPPRPAPATTSSSSPSVKSLRAQSPPPHVRLKAQQPMHRPMSPARTVGLRA